MSATEDKLAGPHSDAVAALLVALFGPGWEKMHLTNVNININARKLVQVTTSRLVIEPELENAARHVKEHFALTPLP